MKLQNTCWEYVLNNWLYDTYCINNNFIYLVNICSLQQTPIFNSWHFSEIFWTENKKDAFLVKNQNLKKKILRRPWSGIFIQYSNIVNIVE